MITTLQQLKTRRKLWLKVHLWLGLSLGFILAIIGLTGSVLVFWQELDRALNPTLYQASSITPSLKPLDEIVKTAKQHTLKDWDSVWLDMPKEPNENYVFNFYYPNNSPKPEEVMSYTVAVNPYTNELAAKRIFYHGWNPLKHSLVGFFFKLHYALFLNKIGIIIVGILAVLFLISLLTGLILGYPLTGKWRRVLTIKKNASIERLNHDVHQTVGFYSFIVLGAVLVSGIYFNLPEQFKVIVNLFSPLTEEAQAKPSPVAAMPLDDIIKNNQHLYQGGNPSYYSLSNDKANIVSTCFKNVPELNQHILDNRCLVFNRSTGQLLQIIDSEHGSAGDKFMQWQWPLHSGQAFGWTGRILVFLSGLACPLLFITGVIRWLQKRKAKSLKLA